MEKKPTRHAKRRITGIILTLLGGGAMAYAGYSQFAPGGDKTSAAGVLLLSLVILFLGISQLYRKDSDDYYDN